MAVIVANHVVNFIVDIIIVVSRIASVQKIAEGTHYGSPLSSSMTPITTSSKLNISGPNSVSIARETCVLRRFDLDRVLADLAWGKK